MTGQLNILDRTTLYLWRALNLLGWSALGVVIALQAHWLAVQTWGSLRTAGYGVAWASEGASLRVWIVRALVALVAGIAIGALAGRKIYRWKVPMAAIASAGYVAIVMITLEHNASGAQTLFGLGDGELNDLVQNSFLLARAHDLFIVAAIPVAVIQARRAMRGS